MDRSKLFDHCYDQYKVQMSEADYLYRRAALWLTANGLVATALAALATGGPTRRFGLDISEPTAAVVGILAAVALATAFVLMGLALLPRDYGRFSLPHEVLIFRARCTGPTWQKPITPRNIVRALNPIRCMRNCRRSLRRKRSEMLKSTKRDIAFLAAHQC